MGYEEWRRAGRDNAEWNGDDVRLKLEPGEMVLIWIMACIGAGLIIGGAFLWIGG